MHPATPSDPGLSIARIVAIALSVGIAVASTLVAFGTGPGVWMSAAAAGATAVVLVCALMRVRASSPPQSSARDTRWTALLDGGAAGTRETLAAVERLTDPLAIEHTITKAMRELNGVQRLELLRAPEAPEGTLTQASAADPSLLQAAIGPGALRRSGAIGPEIAAAMEALQADVVVAVRYDARVYGLLAIEGRLRGSELLALRRFADLLAFKLELHRVYGELSHREQLAALGGFASGVAHDLRSPLSSISLALQGLAPHRDALGADAELLDVAGEEAERLTTWVGELVDASRPVRLQPHPLDLKNIVSSVARRHQRAAVQAGIHLKIEAAPEVPPIVGDAIRLERALDNLVGNAVSVAPRGSDVRIEMRALADGVRIDVIDRGPGIASADRERIFEPFFTRRAGGTGLGLGTAKRIVQAHGGTIEVDSAVGRGTRMSVLLPRKVAASPDR